MISTRALLESPYKQTVRTNRERQRQLELKKGRPVELPEIFHCSITEEVMDHPCNIKLRSEAEDYYIDQSVREALTTHPITNTNVKINKITDKNLAGRINTLLTIEEVLHHVRHIEANRRKQLPSLINNQSASEISALLSYHSKDIFQHYACPDLTIPQIFLSALSNTLMTLPIIIDGNHVIDFFELLASQPARQIPDFSEEEKLRQLKECKKTKLLEATAHYERNLDHIGKDIYHATELNHQHEPMIDRDKLEKVPELIARESDYYQKKTAAILVLTFENICPLMLREYINPFTDKPVEDLSLQLDLLNDIDRFLAVARTHNMLKPIYKEIQTYDKKVQATKPAFANKDYMTILEDAKFNMEELPDELLVASEPGTAFTIIPTHPVILDDSYTTDFHTLLAYWKKTSWGLNPATQQPIGSITYDCKLKDDATNFVLNHAVYARSGTKYHRHHESHGCTRAWGLFSASKPPSSTVVEQSDDLQVSRALDNK